MRVVESKIWLESNVWIRILEYLAQPLKFDFEKGVVERGVSVQ